MYICSKLVNNNSQQFCGKPLPVPTLTSATISAAGSSYSVLGTEHSNPHGFELYTVDPQLREGY